MAPKVPKRSYWIAFAVLVLVALGLAGGTPQSMILQIQNAGSAIATIVNYGVLNCSTGMTCTASGSGVDSGSGTAYVVTGGPITSLTPIGTTECFLPLNANSSSTPTVAFNGLTGKTIVKLTGAVLAISDMVTTQTACVVYNGTNFYLLNPQGATGSGKAVLQTSPSFTAGFTTLNILTSGNCAGVGTGAQASVAACVGGLAGRFSCSTSATSSCQVNTTAVTANSDIIVQQTANTAVGTALSVTCNTATSALLPMVTSQSTGVSFTIQLTQPVTNPDCFYYTIIN